MFYSHFHFESPSDNSKISMGHVTEGKNTWHERNLMNVFIHKWDLAAMAEQSPETKTPLSTKPWFTVQWSSRHLGLGWVARQLLVLIAQQLMWRGSSHQRVSKTHPTQAIDCICLILKIPFSTRTSSSQWNKISSVYHTCWCLYSTCHHLLKWIRIGIKINSSSVICLEI